MSAKILVVTSDQVPGRIFANVPGFVFKAISVHALRFHNLWSYTAVVIATWADDSVLTGCTMKLIRYINRGGFVVCLGCQAHDSQWIPFCRWKDCRPECMTWNTQSATLPKLLDGVERDLLKFHRHWTHGTLCPLTECEILAWADDQPAMCIIDSRGNTGVRGAAFLTTIDPDFHARVGAPRTSGHPEKEIRQNAMYLLRNLLLWCREKYGKAHGSWSRLGRFLLGQLSLPMLFLLLSFVFWPLTVAFVIHHVNRDDPDLWVLFPGVVSLVDCGRYVMEKSWRPRRP